MDKVPFSVYDFFAYLSSGSLLVFAADYVFGNQILLRPTLPVQSYVLLVILSYVIGQLISHLSSVLIEQIFVKRWLGEPITALLAVDSAKTYRMYLFPGFFKPLPVSTQARIRKQLSSRDCTANGTGLFFHCYVIATASNEKLQGRLDEFRNQYGFARNMAFSLFCVGMLLITAHFQRTLAVSLWWSLAAFGVAIGMIYRYLKFFRQYTFELLIRYSELATANS